jgi:hypothetical protein
MPGWVKNVVDQWIQAANITSGKLFRRVHKMGKTWGERLTEKAVWHVVREYATEGWDRQVSAPRSPQLCRRRRTGANPISARSRFDSNNRTIPRLQTADSRCRERQNRNWATRLNEPLSALPTMHQLSWFGVCGFPCPSLPRLKLPDRRGLPI